ncbi:MAG: porin, partial [Bacteroidia bacterium]|nr:porin [Bacteroidia bacterium]
MNKIIIFFAFLATAQIYAAQGGDLNDSVPKKKKYLPQISGVIQVHYLNEFNTNGDNIRDPDGFRILRARLTAKGDINKHISYELMIDPRAPEQGGILRDAYLEFNYIKNQKIRVGQQKTQFGWENRQSITELFTVNRAEMSDGVSRGENLRDIGIGVLGHIRINDNFRFEDALTFTNGTRMNVAGPYDFNTKKALWGRLGLRYKKDDFTLSLGGSYGAGGIRYLGDSIYVPEDDVYADFKRIGIDVQVDHKCFFLAGEYARGTDIVAVTIYGEPSGYQVFF